MPIVRNRRRWSRDSSQAADASGVFGSSPSERTPQDRPTWAGHDHESRHCVVGGLRARIPLSLHRTGSLCVGQPTPVTFLATSQRVTRSRGRLLPVRGAGEVQRLPGRDRPQVGLRGTKPPGHTAAAKLDLESNKAASVSGERRLPLWVLRKRSPRETRRGMLCGNLAVGPHGVQTKGTYAHSPTAAPEPRGSRVSWGPEAGNFLLRPQPGWPHHGPNV